MPLYVNFTQLEESSVQLEGELPVSEIGFDFEDEVVRFAEPLKYRVQVQHLEDSLLMTGDLQLPVACACVRCLKPVQVLIHLRNWACHIPLEGEERPVITRDLVDLTPYIREDMVLALPTHPVCREDCPGLKGKASQALRTAPNGKSGGISSPWEELNKLKFKS